MKRRWNKYEEKWWRSKGRDLEGQVKTGGRRRSWSEKKQNVD